MRAYLIGCLVTLAALGCAVAATSPEPRIQAEDVKTQVSTAYSCGMLARACSEAQRMNLCEAANEQGVTVRNLCQRTPCHQVKGIAFGQSSGCLTETESSAPADPGHEHEEKAE